MNEKRLMEAVGRVDPALVREAHEGGAAQVRRAGPAVRRLVALAAALCLLLAAVPALAAADVEPAYELLYAVSPAAAQGLKPVHLSCTDNGVTMEVISAEVEGSHAAVLLSLRDETGAGRVDETTDLFDSYDLRQSGGFDANCADAGWDEATGTKLFLVSIDQRNGRVFRGGKFTFTLREFLSDKRETAGPLDADLSTAADAPALRDDLDPRGWSWQDERPAQSAYRPMAAQRRQELTPGVQLTALGRVDGELRVQLHFDDILTTDNHGFVTLVNGAGEHRQAEWSADFWDEDGTGSYQELGFRVPEDGDWSLWGEFVTADRLTEGDWQVTFRLEE